MSEVAYQTVYLWECPDCGTYWQARHRPRGGAQLFCVPQPEQHCISGVQRRESGLPQGRAGCGVVHTSTGRRAGVAPTVTSI